MYLSLDDENDKQKNELKKELAALENTQRGVEMRRKNIDAEIDELQQ